jgi:hypothetical protein
MIFQTFQQATSARAAWKIRIVDLGLQPWEGLALGLEAEAVEAGSKRKPVADYVAERGDDVDWGEWLQTHRIELNAMSTPRFIAWLNEKLVGYDKLIPPGRVLEAELDEKIADKVRASITERVLREANVDAQVASALAEIEKPDGAALAAGTKQLFEEMPDAEWRDHVEAAANRCAEGDDA